MMMMMMMTTMIFLRCVRCVRCVAYVACVALDVNDVNLCLQFRRLLPEHRFWWIFRGGRDLRLCWYRFILTQLRPAESYVHHSDSRMPNVTRALHTITPTHSTITSANFHPPTRKQLHIPYMFTFFLFRSRFYVFSVFFN